MKKYFICFLLLLFSQVSFGQLTIASQASCTSYSLTATMTGLSPISSGLLIDDQWSGVIPIGFNFTFYGNTYSQCIIGSNGEVGFDLANAGGFNDWQITSNLLNAVSSGASDIENLIAGPWCDIDNIYGGTIMYSTVGTAPNRKFEVTWCGTAMYDCTTQTTTSQIILYEGTNIAEVHLGHKTICTTWNPNTPPGAGGRGIIGVVNASSTAATTAPGRDWTPVWGASNEGWRFTPNMAGTAYTVASIPYSPIPYASSTIYWYDSTTNAYLGSGVNIVVTPSVTTTYEAAAIGCQDTTKAYITVPAVGSPGSGTNGIVQAAFDLTTHLGCNGDTIFVTNTTNPDTSHSYWSFGDGTGIDSTHLNPIHVYYDNPGYIGTYTVTLTYNTSYNPGCATTHDTVVSFNHPIDAHIISPASDTAVCWLTPIAFAGATISANEPSFEWDLGDNSQAVAGQVVDPYTYALPGNYTVKLTVTDTIGCIRIDSQHVHAIKITTSTAPGDTSVCLKDSITIRAIVNIIPDNYSYSGAWTPNNNLGNSSFTGAGNQEFYTNFFGTGDFVYTFTDTVASVGCISSDTVAIHSFPPITITNVTPSQTIPWGSSIQLNADGGYYYKWAPDDGSLDNPNINNPIAAPLDSVTTYTVYAMSEFGCLDSASLTIRLDNNMTQLVPSAFTPNGDGLNDVFRITKLTFQKLVDFRIFNRWGQQVFQTSNPEIGWDGTFNGVPQDMGVYTYQIIVGLVDGTDKTYKGTVTLIR